MPILLAEDSPDDALLLRLALKKAALKNLLFVVHDGQEAVEYLSGKPPYTNRTTYPLPRLLMLDLKMPRMNGFEVLGWLEGHPEFNELPVIVLSGSDLKEDEQKSKELGADDYRIKSADLDHMVKMLEELHSRWLKRKG